MEVNHRSGNSKGEVGSRSGIWKRDPKEECIGWRWRGAKRLVKRKGCHLYATRLASGAC
jgi:hypothetical protein